MASQTLPGVDPPVHGVMARYDTPADLLHGIEDLRRRGFTKLDAFSPFPIHGLDEALAIPGSKVPWIVLGGAITGFSAGLLLQWWTSAVDYPIRIAGKPFFSIPAFIPVIFELTVLLSAFAAVFGMLALNQLPRLYHPTFKHSEFKRVTDDAFFLVIESRDPHFDIEGAQQALSAAGGRQIEILED